jgi:hypothetical protein
VSAQVVARLSAPAPARDLAAGFEEEGVPLVVEHAAGEALELARVAARRSRSGVGVGGDESRLVVVLAAAPGCPYLEAGSGSARALGAAAARLIARRPLAPPANA